MKKIVGELCLGIAALCMTSASVAKPTNFVTEQSRTASREVVVLLPQSEIKSNINSSNLAAIAGGGLLFAFIDAARNDAKTKRAEREIEPIRVALTDFDADRVAFEGTKAALANVAWLRAAPVSISKDSSLLGKSGMVERTEHAQVAFVEYSYDLSPDFSSMRVVANLQLADKSPLAPRKKPETRVRPKNLAYSQRIVAVVSLPRASKDLELNAAQWSANQGRAARAALNLAFAELQGLLPRTLTLTSADIKAMMSKDHTAGSAGGFFGRIQETDEAGTLLWSGGYVRAVTLPDEA